MATAAIYTPIKTHTGIFSARTAGGRVALTPSPRSLAASNSSPFTSPHARHHDPEWHAEKQCTSFSESLSAAFSSLKVSTPTSVKIVSPKQQAKIRVLKATSSPKSDISKKASSPIRLGLGVSPWTLSSNFPRVKRKFRPEIGKKIIRMNGDRFIPNRSASSPTAATKAQRVAIYSRPSSSKGCTASTSSVLQGGAFGNDDNSSTDSCDDDYFYTVPNADSLAFQSSIAEACGLDLNTRILAFKPKAPELSKPIDLRSQYNRPLKLVVPASQRRRILNAPERVLDAPGLLDDYYLNLLDWSLVNNVAIGLEREVYVWNADSGVVSTLMETPADTYVSSVKWSACGAFVAIGTGDGDVQLWDIEEKTKVRTMKSHQSRIGVMSWNDATISTGARSGNIFNHDVRISEHKVSELNGHYSEVCGLEWRSDGSQLASGGNDNLVNIWDARLLTTPKWTKTNHKAAVKALAWCPWQSNLLATGGGNDDGCIHFWNSTTGARVNSINTGSQVTSLKWSKR